MSDERTILADGGWWEVGSIKSPPSPALTIQSARAGAFKFKLYISRTEAALIIVTARIGRRITHGKFCNPSFWHFRVWGFCFVCIGVVGGGQQGVPPKGITAFPKTSWQLLDCKQAAAGVTWRVLWVFFWNVEGAGRFEQIFFIDIESIFKTYFSNRKIV